MQIAILGRQPKLGLAELESLFGAENIKKISDNYALIDQEGEINISQLGGSLKLGKIDLELSSDSWKALSQKIVQHYYRLWKNHEGKLTLGISIYGDSTSPRDVQRLGLSLKKSLKSVRLIPNEDSALSTATSHHNKLGLSDNKVELIIVSGNKKVFVARSTGAQNITAYAKRDQNRPKRDAFVGMLPPKLAQIMINLATSQMVEGTKYEVRSSSSKLPNTLLDPFCGTGVLLQEAALLGYSVYGTDLSEKMIRYSRDNLNWLEEVILKHKVEWYLHEGDAKNTTWRQPIHAVVTETYLGQPFSAPPSPAKLEEVVGNCNSIISTFLKNLAPQIEPGTPLCLAVPAWRSKDGSFTHLPLVDQLGKLGFKPHEFQHVSKNDLLYYREGQVVARELVVLKRS